MYARRRERVLFALRPCRAARAGPQWVGGARHGHNTRVHVCTVKVAESQCPVTGSPTTRTGARIPNSARQGPMDISIVVMHGSNGMAWMMAGPPDRVAPGGAGILEACGPWLAGWLLGGGPPPCAVVWPLRQPGQQGGGRPRIGRPPR